MTIKEDYVSFEVAKLLKEKGFDAEIDTYYSPEGEFKIWCPNGIKSYLNNNGTETWWWKCITPTQQMAMKWLREVHNIHINVCYDSTYSHHYKFYCCLGAKEKSDARRYDTYEQAAEAGIKYCLENLI